MMQKPQLHFQCHWSHWHYTPGCAHAHLSSDWASLAAFISMARLCPYAPQLRLGKPCCIYLYDLDPTESEI